jgi:hypothetical protein
LAFHVFAGVRRQGDGQALRRAASERLLQVRIDVTDGASITGAPDLMAARSAPPALPDWSTTPAPRWRTPRSSCRWPSSAGSRRSTLTRHLAVI